MAKKKEDAYGGAKVIYKASIVDIRKESVQDKTGFKDLDDYIPRPTLTDGETDAIDYYTETIDKNSYHTRSITVLANCTVGLGMNFEEGSDIKKINARIASVNKYGFSFSEVMNRVAQDHFLSGNGYLECVPDRGGRIGELYSMSGKTVYRRLTDDTPDNDHQFYYLNPESGEKVPMWLFNPKEIRPDRHYLIPFPEWTATEKFYGLPGWRGCLIDIELDYYAVLYQQGFFINHGVPDMAIVVEGGKFDKETNEAVIEFVKSNFKGVGNNNRILYLPINSKDVKVKFEKLAIDSKDQDASFNQLRNTSRDNILSSHGVPPRLAGIVTAGQLGGGGEVEGQLSVFQEITIDPKQVMFEQKLIPVLSSMDIGDVSFTFRKLDTNIKEKRSEYYPMMTESGIMSKETAQKELGLDPDEENKNIEKEKPEPIIPDATKSPELKLVDDLEKIAKAIK